MPRLEEDFRQRLLSEHLLPMVHDQVKIESVAQKLSERGAKTLEEAIAMLRDLEPEARRANRKLSFIDALYEFLRHG